MRATVKRDILKDALGQTNKAVGRSVILPALAGVRLEADGGRLILQRTDLEQTVTAVIDADVEQGGTALVDARALAEAVKAGPETVTITADGETVAVQVGATVRLKAMPVDDFPKLPTAGPSTGVWTGQDLDVLGRVATAASTDEGRPVLTGVQVDQGRAAATDSYRLLAGTLSDDVGAALIPARTVKAWARWNVDRVTVTVEPAQVTVAGTVRFGPKRAPRQVELTWTSKLVDGSFPNWRALMPDDDGPTAWMFEPAEVTEAVKALSPITAGPGEIPVTIRPNGQGVYLTAKLDDVDGETHLPGQTVAGPDGFEWVAVNPKLLAAMAGAMGGRFRLAVKDEAKPLRLTSDLDGLLMPMRVS